MHPIRHQAAPLQRLTNDPGHCFFGYYDLQPWSADGTRHLCHRVPFMDRLPAPTDRAELGFVQPADGSFVPIAETAAWNFQQGSMLQWNPRRPDQEILHNVFRNGQFQGAATGVAGGASRYFRRPFANLASDGAKALSVNFSRLLDFRPGYGYAGLPDPYANVAAPADDGVFLLDLTRDEAALIVSLATVRECFVEQFGTHMRDAKVLINHITFNPSASRFLFIARNMAMPGKQQQGWASLVATAAVDGSDLHVFNGHGNASHYCWRDDTHILIYADLPERGKLQLCLVEDQSQRSQNLDPEFFRFDGHCTYSPDLRFVLYDSYPDADCYRKLLIYDTLRRRAIPLAELYSVPTPQDARCDLHPRWNRDGSSISFDSTHEGERAVYTMDVLEFYHEA